ncbi:MAG TPA: hypothetical protein VN256_20390, partial [Pyrinomonadaceae bacterium]|nr:hypothetical protein [Pyrinomonadaceae bacterium]
MASDNSRPADTAPRRRELTRSPRAAARSRAAVFGALLALLISLAHANSLAQSGRIKQPSG